MSDIRASNLAALIALVAFSLVATALAQDRPPARPAATQPATGQDASNVCASSHLAIGGTVSRRYTCIEDAHAGTVQNRMQWQAQIHGAFRVDAAGRYRVHMGLTTGDNFSAGWNSTGVGAGEGSEDLPRSVVRPGGAVERNRAALRQSVRRNSSGGLTSL